MKPTDIRPAELVRRATMFCQVPCRFRCRYTVRPLGLDIPLLVIWWISPLMCTEVPERVPAAYAHVAFLTAAPAGTAVMNAAANADRKSTRLNSSHLGISYA